MCIVLFIQCLLSVAQGTVELTIAVMSFQDHVFTRWTYSFPNNDLSCSQRKKNVKGEGVTCAVTSRSKSWSYQRETFIIISHFQPPSHSTNKRVPIPTSSPLHTVDKIYHDNQILRRIPLPHHPRVILRNFTFLDASKADLTFPVKGGRRSTYSQGEQKHSRAHI